MLSLISISQSSLWRQQKEIDGLVRINSWNQWERSVCVRTSLELPRIKVESRLGWLRPETCSDTWVYPLICKAAMGRNINFRQLAGATANKLTLFVMEFNSMTAAFECKTFNVHHWWVNLHEIKPKSRPESWYADANIALCLRRRDVESKS